MTSAVWWSIVGLLCACGGTAPRVSSVAAGDRAQASGDDFLAAVEYRHALDAEIPGDHPEHARVRGYLQAAVDRWLESRARVAGDDPQRLEALLKAWNTALVLSVGSTRSGEFAKAWQAGVGAAIAEARARADKEPHAALERAQWLAASAQRDPDVERMRAELGERVRVRHAEAAAAATGHVRTVHHLAALARTSQELPKAELDKLRDSLVVAVDVSAAPGGACAADATAAVTAARDPALPSRPKTARVVAHVTSCSPHERRWTADEEYTYTVTVQKTVSRKVPDGEECEAPRMVHNMTTTCSSYGTIGQNSYCSGWTQVSSVTSVPGSCKPKFRFESEVVDVEEPRKGMRTTEFLELRYDLTGRAVISIDGTTIETPFSITTTETDRAFRVPAPVSHTLTAASVRAQTTSKLGTWLRGLGPTASSVAGAAAIARGQGTGDAQAFAEAALRGTADATEWAKRTTGLTPQELVSLLDGRRPDAVRGYVVTETIPERVDVRRHTVGTAFDRGFYRGVNARLLSGKELALAGTALDGGGAGFDLTAEYILRGEKTGSYGPRVRLGLASAVGDTSALELTYRFYLGDTRRSRQRFVLGTGITFYEQRWRDGETTFRNAGVPVDVYVRATDFFSLDGGLAINAFKLLDVLNLSDSDEVSHGLPIWAGASIYLGTSLRLYGRSEIVVVPYRAAWHSVGAAVRW